MKVYADQRHLPAGLPHCAMLYPFWGPAMKPEVGELYGSAFGPYLARGREFFELTPLREARAAVLPFQWEQVMSEAVASRFDLALWGKDEAAARRTMSEARRAAGELAAEASAEGVPLVVFLLHFAEGEAPPVGSWTFRPSLYASRRGAREFAQPFWIRDEVAESFGGELPVRRKGAKPVVGFCGQVPPRPDPDWRSRWARRLAAVPALSRPVLRSEVERMVEPTFAARARALTNLAQGRSVEANFVLRNGWFGGAFERGLDAARLRRARGEYFENLFGSDYVLCTRGYGNCSVRFYEALSCGRVPVFVNTDCVLPFDWVIDWRRYTVWVEEHELASIGERVAEFHERLTEADFEELQRECRRVWERWLSPHGFFENFHRHFGARV